MQMKYQIMTIINGRFEFLDSDLNRQVAKLNAERHRNLINIIDQAWDKENLIGRNSKDI